MPCRTCATPDLARRWPSTRIDAVVHLASIVTPGPGSTREFEYSVDVLGTRNVLEACVAQGVQHIVVSSSGAAYGYHADNPAVDRRERRAARQRRPSPTRTTSAWSRKCWPTTASTHPALRQTVLRIGTILGDARAQPDHGAVRQAAHPGDPRQRQPLRLHLGRGRDRLRRARDHHRARRLLQRGGRRRADAVADRRAPAQAAAVAAGLAAAAGADGRLAAAASAATAPSSSISCATGRCCATRG